MSDAYPIWLIAVSMNSLTVVLLHVFFFVPLTLSFIFNSSIMLIIILLISYY